MSKNSEMEDYLDYTCEIHGGWHFYPKDKSRQKCPHCETMTTQELTKYVLDQISYLCSKF